MPYHKYYQETTTVTVAKDAAISGAFYIPNWAVFVGVLFPAMDNGDITLKCSQDGTNYYPVLDPTDGADAVLCTSGEDAGFIDISDWVRFVPNDLPCKFACATQSTAAVTIRLYFRG